MRRVALLCINVNLCNVWFRDSGILIPASASILLPCVVLVEVHEKKPSLTQVCSWKREEHFLFLYLFGCSGSQLWHVNSYWWLVGSVPDQGSSPVALHWEQSLSHWTSRDV